MAVWQYHLFGLPSEKVEDYFSECKYVRESDYDDFPWWDVVDVSELDYVSISDYLGGKGDHWDEDSVLYGDLDSDCIYYSTSDEDNSELLIRIDLRENYQNFIKHIIEFSVKNNITFINLEKRIIPSTLILLIEDLRNSISYKFMSDPKGYLNSLDL